MAASWRGSTYVYWKVCDTDFTVAGGGVHEVKRHMETKKHQENAKCMENQLTIQGATYVYSATQQESRFLSQQCISSNLACT